MHPAHVAAEKVSLYKFFEGISLRKKHRGRTDSYRYITHSPRLYLHMICEMHKILCLYSLWAIRSIPLCIMLQSF
jgi:hypothetical protein